MSQRTSLLLSLALTLVVAFAIVVGRDQLFATSASSSDSQAPPVVVTTPATSAPDATRIIEIALPSDVPEGEQIQIGNNQYGEEDDSATSQIRSSSHDDGNEGEHEEHDDD